MAIEYTKKNPSHVLGMSASILEQSLLNVFLRGESSHHKASFDFIFCLKNS